MQSNATTVEQPGAGTPQARGGSRAGSGRARRGDLRQRDASTAQVNDVFVNVASRSVASKPRPSVGSGEETDVTRGRRSRGCGEDRSPWTAVQEEDQTTRKGSGADATHLRQGRSPPPPPLCKAPAVCETPPTAMDDRFDAKERARENQWSREKDDRSLAHGETSAQQLKRECGYFAFPRVRMTARGSKPLE